MIEKITSATFNIEINNGKIIVKRDIQFGPVNSVSFSVTMPIGEPKTIPDLNRESAQKVIDLMQQFLVG